jgi:TonB family protein
VQGTVKLRVTLLASGNIGAIELVVSLGAGLDQAAFEAARSIKFLPAEIDGKPVDVTMNFEYGFTIY